LWQGRFEARHQRFAAGVLNFSFVMFPNQDYVAQN
jgi:hypothetical protein